MAGNIGSLQINLLALQDEIKRKDFDLSTTIQEEATENQAGNKISPVYH